MPLLTECLIINENRYIKERDFDQMNESLSNLTLFSFFGFIFVLLKFILDVYSLKSISN